MEEDKGVHTFTKSIRYDVKIIAQLERELTHKNDNSST